MKKGKAFCKQFTCIHCSQEEAIEIRGQFWKRCQLEMYTEEEFKEFGCMNFAAEKRWGHDTILCSSVDCVHCKGLGEVYLGIQYRTCGKHVSVAPTFKEGCRDYQEAREGSQG